MSFAAVMLAGLPATVALAAVDAGDAFGWAVLGGHVVTLLAVVLVVRRALAVPAATRARKARGAVAAAMQVAGVYCVVVLVLAAVTPPDCGVDYAGPCHRLGWALLAFGGLLLETGLGIAWAALALAPRAARRLRRARRR